MSSNLPKLKIKLTKYQQRLITLGWLIIAMNFIIVGISYTNLPDIIPAHFNYKGEVDGFGTKSTIWTFPILSSIIYSILYLVIKNINLWNMNYPIKVTDENAPEIYKTSLKMLVYIKVLIALIATPIIIEIILQAHDINLGFKFSSLSIVTVISITIIPFFYIFKMYKTPKK